MVCGAGLDILFYFFILRGLALTTIIHMHTFINTMASTRPTHSPREASLHFPTEDVSCPDSACCFLVRHEVTWHGLDVRACAERRYKQRRLADDLRCCLDQRLFGQLSVFSVPYLRANTPPSGLPAGADECAVDDHDADGCAAAQE